MQMIKNLHATNKTLEEEIESYKKVAQEKVYCLVSLPISL